MSRMTETQKCVEDMKMDYEKFMQSDKYIAISMLTEIALSLAVIADKMTEVKEDG